MIQQRIVQAYERDRDFEKAWHERDLLVKEFSQGSPWYEANKNDAEVIAKTREIMEHSLYSSAVFHHQQAQEYKKAQKYDLALKEFQEAALAYGTYLDRFPHAKNLYETRFFHAETLYNSLQFGSGGGRVCKGPRRPDRRQVCQRSFLCRCTGVAEGDRPSSRRPGKLDSPPLYKAAERPKDMKLAPVEMEEIRSREIQASDTFVRLLPKDEKAPELLYGTGEMYYRHDQFDEARRRFQLVIDQYPDSPVAQFASNLTLEDHTSPSRIGRKGRSLFGRRRSRRPARRSTRSGGASSRASSWGRASSGADGDDGPARTYEEAARACSSPRSTTIRSWSSPTRRSTTPPSVTNSCSVTTRR